MRNLIVVVASLAACSASADMQRADITTARRLSNFTYLFEYRLADGTRCASVTSEHGASITCDWGRK